jgi:pantetheine-phosphate adenylyltransferase
MKHRLQIALMPLSADPPTLAHADLLQRACQLFPKVYWAVGVNPDKKYMFTCAQRVEMLQCYVEHLRLDAKQVSVVSYQGATIPYAQSVQVNVIIKGLRNPLDFQFEADQAAANTRLDSDIQTVFLPARPELSSISSTLLRQLIQLKQPFADYVIPAVEKRIVTWCQAKAH